MLPNQDWKEFFESLGECAVIQFGHPPVRLDLLTSIGGVSFDDAWLGKVAGDFDGVPVQYVGRAELLRNKRAAGRPKDSIEIHRPAHPRIFLRLLGPPHEITLD